VALVQRLFGPLMHARAQDGAALDWKTALQELSAERGLGVPDYRLDESGPDHAKRFTAVVHVGGQPQGEGDGRSKKEAEQRAAEAAFGRACRPVRRTTTGTDVAGEARTGRCLSCPRSRSSAAGSSAASPAARSRTSR
jgi:ribonuclease-3